jgi:lipoate-protein ligase A
LTAFVVTPSAPAFVLGSTQSIDTVDPREIEASLLTVVRRRSGGGGVLVRPDAQLWLDLFVPAGHAVAHRDVSKAALVAGRLWSDALNPLVRETLVVHDGALMQTPWSRVDCFSGVGPGEVLLNGRKLVGISQRRVRAGTWFFTMAHVSFDPSEHARIARLDPASRSALESQLAGEVTTLPVGVTVALAALVAAVERLSG